MIYKHIYTIAIHNAYTIYIYGAGVTSVSIYTYTVHIAHLQASGFIVLRYIYIYIYVVI